MSKKKWIAVKDVTWGDMGDFLEAHGQALSSWSMAALTRWKDHGEDMYAAQTRLQEATFDWLTTEGQSLNPNYGLHFIAPSQLLCPHLLELV